LSKNRWSRKFRKARGAEAPRSNILPKWRTLCAPPLTFHPNLQLLAGQQTHTQKQETTMRKKKKEIYREHTNLVLNCLRQEWADQEWTDIKSFIQAFRLRMAIGSSRNCPDQACRRHDICARPILECTHRPKADDYDWDWGWFHCQRKDIYGADKDAWNPGTRGGTPEQVEEQMQAHRDSYEAFAKDEEVRNKR
jgi:hypothetical protein